MKMSPRHFGISACALLMLSAPALAYDGTINFLGVLTTSTCTVDAGSLNQTVQMPTIQTQALPSSGSWAGRTPFSIRLSACSLANATTVGLYFENTGDIDNSNGTLKNTAAAAGAATGVQIRLLNTNYFPINLAEGTMVAQKSLPVAPDASHIAKLDYYAEYYSTSNTVTAGNVNAKVLFSLNYQ